jgi:hypothetical protein
VDSMEPGSLSRRYLRQLLGERRVRAENGPLATASDCVSETGEASRRAGRLAPFRLELCAPSFKRYGLAN